MRNVLILLLISIFLVGCQTTPKVKEEPKEAEKTFNEVKKMEENAGKNRIENRIVSIVDDLIRKKLNLGMAQRLEVYEITSRAPYHIPGIKLYSSCHMFGKDPIPHDLWVFVPPDKLYDRMIDALKEMHFVPKSEEEALKVTRLIIFVEDDGAEIYPDFERYSGLENQYAGLAAPVVYKKGNYYEIVLFATVGPSWAIHKWPGVAKYKIKIGNGVYECVYEQIEEKRPEKLK